MVDAVQLNLVEVLCGAVSSTSSQPWKEIAHGLANEMDRATYQTEICVVTRGLINRRRILRWSKPCNFPTHLNDSDVRQNQNLIEAWE